MSQNQNSFLSRNRVLVIIVAIMVVICLVLAAVAAFFIIREWFDDDTQVQVTPTFVDTTTDQGGSTALVSGEDARLYIRLSEGQAEPQAAEPFAISFGDPLSDEQIAQIIARLPELVLEDEDQVDFKIPEDVLPPPLTGETIEETFPPPPDAVEPEVVPSGPLEVLRFGPEGEIPLAPFINVTFNQPMVPLTTLHDLSAEDIPLRVEPTLPGTWRWIGTKTLTFQYDSALIDRLPMATEYQVTIPAGTESDTGGVLEGDVQWSFSTPPPEMLAKYPNQIPQPLEPIFFISFDQRIDPDAVLETIQVTADNKPVSLRLATEADIKKDETVSRMVKHALEGRWLAFQATEPLPPDSPVSIVIGPGTPSAEGSLLTQNEQHYSFHTYAPLRIEEADCSWSEDKCRPLSPFYIRFNNPIDPQAYEDGMILIKPELPGATVNIFGNTINIRGATKAQTTYKVTVDKALQDIFGQTLGKSTTLTFKVGPAEPLLIGPDDILVTLDPASTKPILSLYTINYNKLDLKVYAVQPSDWGDFKEYLREYQRTDKPLSPPGRLVRDETKRLEAPSDILTEVGIDLSEDVDGSFGHFIVIVKPPKGFFEEERYWETIHVWVQVTQIGVDAIADHSEMVVWTSGLKDGAPLSGVTIETKSGTQTYTTGDDGTVRFELPSTSISYLVARQGADKAILPRSTYFWGDDNWYKNSIDDQLRWYVFDDRQMYKPGEEVHVKGWIRQVGSKQDGDVGLMNSSVTSVEFQVMGPQGNDIGGGRVEVNSLGGFDFAFTLPENVNLGYAQLYLDAQNVGRVDGRQYYHSFQIQEFRRPEFEVVARNETVGPYIVGEHAIIAVEAKYFAGGPLPNAEVNWLVESSPTNYEPPNWSDFIFGIWEPWWWYYRPMIEAEYYAPYVEYGDIEYETFSGVTDATGNHYLRLDFDEADEPRPFSVLAEATVFDVNRQAWAGTTSLMLHPANLYVGLRSERTFVERGTPLDIELIVTDIDGNPVIDRQIKVTSGRLEWKYRGNDWGEEVVDVQDCTVGSTLEPVTCTFETPVGGRYQITASVTDEMGRDNLSQFTRWVSGGQLPPARKVEQETVTLIPEKDNYQPGDVARILVQAPFSTAEGLLTVSRSGILYTERFRIEEDSTTLSIPIEEKHIPNLHIQVDLVGAAPRSDDQGEILPGAPPRPAYASGQLTLSIPPLQRTLSLEVIPRDSALEPGGETLIDVTLKDANGNPVADAELAAVVVDEAILALTNYQLVDPLTVFYSQRPSYLSSQYGRASIILTDPLALLETGVQAGGELRAISVNEIVEVEKEVMLEAAVEEAGAPPMADMGFAADDSAGTDTTPIRLRMDFNPLATFAPTVRTDANGQARVEVTVPDNLTRYRVMVVAVDEGGSQFGSAESNIVARLPLMVRPSAPRFLNFGDSFELPVVVQNQTDETLVIDVVVQASNIELTNSSGVRVSVPANDRVEVRFPATTVMAGTARFQFAAVSGTYADAAKVELPVYTPATTEAFATYGVVDEGAVAQPIAQPTGVFPQYGGLEISTSSTALQALTDAVLYLYSYPYECSEQLASRILAIAGLRDVLTAFKAAGLPSVEQMEAAVSRDIERLKGLQNYDGGFPYWRRGRDSIPYNTIHVAHALQRAELKGFSVPNEMKQNVLNYLRDIESYYPHWYGKRTRQTLSAYALYVRNLMGDRDTNKTRLLLNESALEEFSLDAIAWIWGVLIDDSNSLSELDAIRRHISNRVVETASAANFTIHYHDQTYLLLSSDRRTDAIILDALIADDPQSDLIPKVVNGLLAHRKRGRWGNTQENVFVLLALDRYFNTFEAQTPNFVASIWLGDTYAGSHEFIGRTTERHETEIPMAYLLDATSGGTQDLILSKDGPGRLYYRLGLRYAPTDLNLDPVDMGFVVQRVYEAVDDTEDVFLDSEGVWHIKAGARVRIRLTMVADNRRYHVALIDPLPAGLEIVNPALAVSGAIPQDPSSQDYRYGWWWWWTWYEHQNMRDERAEVFTSLLWDGVYEYTYIARATTPGTFVVPPAKAEEMYSPEVFGRSSSDWVIVD